MPGSPSLPPVSATHLMATSYRSWAKAKVSMAMYTPRECTAKYPTTTARSAAAAMPISSAAHSENDTWRSASAAP